MDLFAIDDSAQKKPSRSGMGPLVAVGGVRIPGENLRALEVGLDELCAENGFPRGEEFKWSPGRRDWMYRNLVEDSRTQFFLDVLKLARDLGSRAIVVIEDTKRKMARVESRSHEEDVTALFLERADTDLGYGGCGLIVFDRPPGNRKSEAEFLAGAIERIRAGTGYTELDKLALALSSDSRLSRSLQVADIVTASTTAYVSGESNFSPPVFEHGVLPILCEVSGCKGGRGLKIHPDFTYGNLYHWLLGDEILWRGTVGIPLPSTTQCNAYRASPDVA